VRQILNVDSLRAFEARDLCLEEVVGYSLFGVLRFESIDLAGLGAELGLKYFPWSLAGSCSGVQLPLGRFKLGLEVRG
jgi:hypothetical protein